MANDTQLLTLLQRNGFSPTDAEAFLTRFASTGQVPVDANIGKSYRLRRAAGQSINHNSSTAVLWDTEELDTGVWTAGDPGKWVTPFSGRYSLEAQIQFTTGGTGVHGADWIKNGGTTLMSALCPGNSVAIVVFQSMTLDLVAGDYIELKVYQNYGAARTTGTCMSLTGTRVR